MVLSTTTTTTTNPQGETTIQKVESDATHWYDTEENKFHAIIENWLGHLQVLTKSLTWTSLAYAAYTFARHLV